MNPTQVVDDVNGEVISVTSVDRTFLEDAIDAIWWSTLMTDSVYVKIRWSPIAVEAHGLPGNEQIVMFTGSKSVKIEPSRPSPFCFTRREVIQFNRTFFLVPKPNPTLLLKAPQAQRKLSSRTDETLQESMSDAMQNK